MTTCTCGARRPLPITTPCQHCKPGNHGTPLKASEDVDKGR